MRSLEIVNFEGKDELGSYEYWQGHILDIETAYPFPDLWNSVNVIVYPKRHPNNPDTPDNIAGKYNTELDRIRLFLNPDRRDMSVYEGTLAHECGHHYGDEIHFQYPTNKIERGLDVLFDALLPETGKGRREDFAEMCGVISGKDPMFFDKKDLKYSNRLETLMKTAWPVRKRLMTRQYRNLRVDSKRVYWEETRTKRVWWWTETVSLGWFGVDKDLRLLRYSNGAWVSA